MKRGFYVVTTILLFLLFIFLLLFRANFVFSLEDYVNQESAEQIKQSSVDGGPNIDLSQSIEDNSKNNDGNVDITFTVRDDQLIRSCTLYDNINQPFGPDKKQINTFVQLDYPVTFNLENIDNGKYQWSIVCEDRLFRSNSPIVHTFVVKKLPPKSLDIPYIEVGEDGVFVLNLSSYFSDPKDSDLKYKSLINSKDIKIKIDPVTGLTLIEPQKNWFGESDLKFAASNKFGLETESNQIHIIVSEQGDTPPRFESLKALGVINDTLDDDGYLFLQCNVTDDYAIKEISLYSDTSGEWKLEETKNIDSIDSSALFNLTDVSNGEYSWTCSAKDDNGNETIGEKQPIDVNVDVSLEHTIPKFMVNNVETDRSVYISFSGYLNNSVILGELVIKKPDGLIYYKEDMSKAQHFEFDSLGTPKILYFKDIKIVPDEIFNSDFRVGKKANIEMVLDYTYQGIPYEKVISHQIEVTSRTISEDNLYG